MRFECTKRVRSQLSQLAAVAYERELGACIQDLSQLFSNYERGEIDAWKIDEALCRYANGPERRRLFDRYNTKSILHMSVAQAIVRHILRSEEIPMEVMVALKDPIAFYERGFADGSVSFDVQD